MKHLRLFESYMKDFYTEMSIDEVEDLYDGFEQFDISKSHYNKISNIFGKNWEVEYESESYDNSLPINLVSARLFSERRGKNPKAKCLCSIDIRGLYDDYFFISMIKYSKGRILNNRYFKCDTIEGLEHFLKDIVL
jgi:hypothetical protein